MRADVGSALRIGIGAGDILLASIQPSGLSARNIIPGRVVSLAQRDVIVVAKVNCGVEMEVHLTLAARDSLQLQPGLRSLAGSKDPLLPPDGNLAGDGGRASPPGWTGGTPVLQQNKKPRRRATRLLRNSRKRYTLNDDPQPQVLFTFGFSNLKPAPSRVST